MIFEEQADGEYIAYGAFVTDEAGTQKLVGSVITELGEKTPEVLSVMVLPDYRKQHLASIMLQDTLSELYEKGYSKTWLVTQCDNEPAINLYKKHGFSIFAHEQRFMRYI